MALTIIKHKGKDIVVADFSNMNKEKMKEAMIEFNKDLIAAGKKQLILMDQAGVKADSEITELQKKIWH